MSTTAPVITPVTTTTESDAASAAPDTESAATSTETDVEPDVASAELDPEPAATSTESDPTSAAESAARRPTALLVPPGTPVNSTLADLLRADGWTVVATAQTPVDALVVDPGLLDGGPVTGAARALLDLVESTPFPSREDGGAAVVVVGSRDQLGWGDRPELAAEAAAVFGAARSLALRLAPAGITVNLVAGRPVGDGPAGLLPEPATPADIAASAAFLAHPRSRYITGQLVFCDAGAALLSSLSV